MYVGYGRIQGQLETIEKVYTIFTKRYTTVQSMYIHTYTHTNLIY